MSSRNTTKRTLNLTLLMLTAVPLMARLTYLEVSVSREPGGSEKFLNGPILWVVALGLVPVVAFLYGKYRAVNWMVLTVYSTFAMLSIYVFISNPTETDELFTGFIFYWFLPLFFIINFVMFASWRLSLRVRGRRRNLRPSKRGM